MLTAGVEVDRMILLLSAQEATGHGDWAPPGGDGTYARPVAM
jgi:hypothetical protein